MKVSKQLFVSLGVLLLSIGLWVSLALSGVLDGMEQETLRWRYLARGELTSSAPVVHVDLDAETVSYMGDRPWDRREFAVLLHALLGPGQANVVSLDIILSKYGAGALLDLERARKGDAFLGQTIEAFAEQVILAAGYTGVTSSLTDEAATLPLIRDGYHDPEQTPFPEAPTFPIIQFETGRLALANVDEELSGGAVPYYVPAFVRLAGPRYSFHLIDGAMRQMENVLNQPEALVEGDVVKLTDQDGWTPLALPMEYEMTLYSLGLETFLAANKIGADQIEIKDSELLLYDTEGVYRRIPLVEGQSIEVNWFKGWDRNKQNARVSMQAVIRKAHALAAAAASKDVQQVSELEAWFLQFKDKVIFVGPVDPQLKDISPTPFNREPVPKVGLHVNLYRTIQDEAYMRRANVPVSVGLISLLTILVSLLMLGSRNIRLLFILAFVSFCSGAFLVFAHLNWIVPMVAPVGSALTAAISMVLLKLGSEELERRRIKTLFGAYVAPKLVDEMVDSKQDPKLGGAEAEITALFSDVEGFSSLSEELAPHKLVALMNEYLGAMTEVFQAHSGTLDKYIGDAIVTMFGMPVPVADHARRACLSAIEMQERHATLRKEWAESGEWPESVLNMRTRVGLNTGVAVIGNMGSDMRFNYTMMGDMVNLAARCESGAKIYGVYTLVTGETLDAAISAGASLRSRKLDRIVVKGRSQPVDIYELWEPSISEEMAGPCKAAYEAALEQYFSGDWSSALSGFEKSAAFEPAKDYSSTTPSAVLAERCRDLIANGDRDSWDGVYKMQTK